MIGRTRHVYDAALVGALIASALLFLVPQFFFIRQSLLPNVAPGVVGDTISLDNYREIIQEAKRTQKPIFLEFRCEP